jgi:3-hydroxybutyryl-CoA dehydrogenase
MMELRKVGVVGCGLMGAGITQVSAQSGYDTTVVEVSRDFLEKGLGRIDRFLTEGVRRGKVREEDKAATLKRIRGSVELKDLASCDIVIEAVVENIDLKKEVFRKLSEIVRAEVILASNTSSLSITEMMTAVATQERFIGIHFFNPVPLMRLVEVVRTVKTEPEVYRDALKFTESLGKVSLKAHDSTGFIVNRLLVPFMLDAIRALESGVGSIEDVDQGMKLGCGHPMGPFTLLDFVGIETTYYIANIMFEDFRETRFAPPPLMKRMVLAGFHGRKTGIGFYDYSGARPVPNTRILT